MEARGVKESSRWLNRAERDRFREAGPEGRRGGVVNEKRATPTGTGVERVHPGDGVPERFQLCSCILADHPSLQVAMLLSMSFPEWQHSESLQPPSTKPLKERHPVSSHSHKSAVYQRLPNPTARQPRNTLPANPRVTVSAFVTRCQGGSARLPAYSRVTSGMVARGFRPLESHF